MMSSRSAWFPRYCQDSVVTITRTSAKTTSDRMELRHVWILVFGVLGVEIHSVPLT